MGRPPIDLAEKITEIVDHVEPMTSESGTPLKHYVRSVNDLWNLRVYTVKKIRDADHYPKVASDHLAALDRMLLVNVIEAFERFLKEVGAVCIDHLAKYVLDGRFDDFSVKGNELAAHFEEDTLGKALCESSTWLNCKTINDRFRHLLADPFDSGKGQQQFYVFPGKSQPPEDERFRHDVMSLIWQLRHTIVHNVGVITRSDSVKLRLLARRVVTAPRLLRLTRDDLLYVKRFLDETAEKINERVCDRLAELLTTLHGDDPSLFDPLHEATALAGDFDRSVTVAKVTAGP